ncbi:MAG: hypothetical protein ACXADC_12425 [Candidatus Thorarchaeota archaeon]|jgi:hypothetical protein
MKHAPDEEGTQQTRGVALMPKHVWGFEGCGAMWTFYSDRKEAIESAMDNRVHELEVYEAFLLDNSRRHEMGYPPITFDQFLECVNHPIQCAPDDIDCQE